MSSLKAKDRVSLCMFTFADGRRCRTPRAAKHPHFCFYHAQKEARARAAETLGKDLAYFFSGDYLSACDLSTALGRLIPAVLRGDVKPRAARTVAYLAQTLMQAIHISQDEYTNAFGSDAWRKSIRNSVNENHGYRFPPAPQPNPAPAPAPEPPQVQAPPVQAPNAPADPKLNCHSACPGPVGERSEGPPTTAPTAPTSSSVPQTPSSPVCHPACHGPAGERSEGPQPIPATQHPSLPTRHSPPLPPTGAEFAQHVMASFQPPTQSQANASALPSKAPQPAAGCHSERSEESAFSSSNSSPVTRHSPLPIRRPVPNRDPYALHFDLNCRLRPDKKLL